MTSAILEESTDLRERARQCYLESVASGTPLNGKQLGEMFYRSERWGRERKAEAEQDDSSEQHAEHDAPAEQVDTEDVHTVVPFTGATAAASPTDAAQGGDRDDRADEAAAVVRKVHNGQPRGARFVVWTAFLLGIAASVAANVAHAQPTIGPRIAGAFVPLALLLAVECMSRPSWRRSGFWWGLTRYGGTGLVALVAAVLSYRHMAALLIRYGEDPFNAALGPLAVDGLMVVAGFALLAMAQPPAPVTEALAVDDDSDQADV